MHNAYSSPFLFFSFFFEDCFSFFSSCTFISFVTGKINIWRISRKFMDYLGVNIKVTPNSSKIQKGQVMFLCNHRSWADFFTDTCLCGGPSYISRYAVIFGVPGFAFCAWNSGCIWLFRRRRGIDRKKFTEFFAHNWKFRYNDGVIVYPEGHRYKKEGYLPLKTGVLEVAYNLNRPVQCVLTSNKEEMLNEMDFCLEFNTTLVSAVSEPLYPAGYKTKEEWFQACKDLWEKTYQDLKNNQETAQPCSFPLPGVLPEETNAYAPITHRAVLSMLTIAAVSALVYGLFHYVL